MARDVAPTRQQPRPNHSAARPPPPSSCTPTRQRPRVSAGAGSPPPHRAQHEPLDRRRQRAPQQPPPRRPAARRPAAQREHVRAAVADGALDGDWLEHGGVHEAVPAVRVRRGAGELRHERARAEALPQVAGGGEVGQQLGAEGVEAGGHHLERHGAGGFGRPGRCGAGGSGSGGGRGRRASGVLEGGPRPSPRAARRRPLFAPTCWSPPPTPAAPRRATAPPARPAPPPPGYHPLPVQGRHR